MSKVVSFTVEELEEALESILPSGYEIKHTRNGIVIHTFLKENSYGELISTRDEDDEDDSLFDDDDMESMPEDEEEDD